MKIRIIKENRRLTESTEKEIVTLDDGTGVYYKDSWGGEGFLIFRHDDWVNGRIDKEKVMIVKYDRMMSDFEGLMSDVLKFIEHEPSKELLEEINKTAEEQRNYKSQHKYDLEKFGLTEEKIRKDCKKIYETFFNE